LWSLRGQAGHRAASQTQLSNPGAGPHARLCPLVRTPAWRSAASASQESLTPVPQMFPERGLRFAFALQSPAVDRTERTFCGGQARKAYPDQPAMTFRRIKQPSQSGRDPFISREHRGRRRMRRSAGRGDLSDAQRKTPLRCMRRLSSARFNLLAMLSALTAPRPCGAAWGTGGFGSGPAE